MPYHKIQVTTRYVFDTLHALKSQMLRHVKTEMITCGQGMRVKEPTEKN